MSATRIDPDDYDRLVKLLVDDGSASSFLEAGELLATYRLQLVVDATACRSEAWQAGVLTAVNTGRRAMHGGVSVVLADPNAPTRTALGQGTSLREDVELLGGRVVATSEAGLPTLIVGTAPASPLSGRQLTLCADQWRAGVAISGSRAIGREATPLTACIAAAIGVAESFQYLRGYVLAGDRATGLSLWRPDLPWLSGDAAGPALKRLPEGAWLLGLGHLGQAYAWTLTCLPYVDDAARSIVLQDDDRITKANRATSMYERGAASLGQRKARLVAAGLEGAGFTTTVIERRYHGGPLRESADPNLLLSGLDNPQTRQLLDETGFGIVLDAGLGTGPAGYLGMRVRRLPARRSSRQLWNVPAPEPPPFDRINAYKKLAESSGDRCGVEQLAGRSVATAFVGVVAAGIVIGSVIRELHGGQQYSVIDASLRDLGSVAALAEREQPPMRLSSTPARPA